MVEVGSNDGYLCLQLLNAGYKVNGVDVAESMVEQAIARGIPTHNKLFGLKTSLELVDLIGNTDFLIANNVFNHANDPLDFYSVLNKF